MVLVSVSFSSYRKDISNRARNIIQRAEKQLLQERVKCINAIHQDNQGRIADSKSRLFSLLTNTTTQQKCTEFIDKVREFNFIKVRDREVNTFNRLRYKNKSKPEVRQQNAQSIDNRNSQVQVLTSNSHSQGSNTNSHVTNHVNKWVINLSSIPLAPTQKSLLSKGPNFALAPSNPPNVEFISAKESVCHKLSD